MSPCCTALVRQTHTRALTQKGHSCKQASGSSIPVCCHLPDTRQVHVSHLWCRMAEGLYTDEEDDADASPAASGAYSQSSDTDAHEHHQPPTQPQPHPQVGQGIPEPRRQDAAASRDLEREIAQALAADAAFLEDPSMTLREGALLPLEAGQEEGGFELPALSAGGTISKVSQATACSHPLLTRQNLLRAILLFFSCCQGLAWNSCWQSPTL